ncbi:uncharacterized protein LOC120149327 isoform X2 [Hibiscus syriacus]|uniref:uncharacterized protein LOC120149327 isoform X2 n=1 Tax=Hibiscus syriacus TaxID=106335 RepID=UPI001922CC58|nr:uncharacterized protein LOC120149327 isoform X2 [Hibiscus syriacus]
MNKYGSTTSDIEFDADAVYLTLTSLVGQTYNAQIMKEWHIHEPKLHYIHRFLAYNYSGRNGTTSCLNERCLQTMELLAGNPKAPYFVPPDTITPRGDRVYILRVAPSPPEDSPQPDVQAQINEVYGHLNSIETNIAKILSYLC